METLTVEQTTKASYWAVPGVKSDAIKKPETLLAAVCREFGIPEYVLWARMTKQIKTRKREIVNALQAYVYLVYTVELTKIIIINGIPKKQDIPMGWRTSPVAVAKHSGYDHASIYHCEEVIQNYIDTEPAFAKKIKRLIYGLKTYQILMPEEIEFDPKLNTNSKN